MLKKGIFKPTGTSQILKNEALKFSKNVNKILDLGCGSGLIGISILEKYPDKSLYFSDISKYATNKTKLELKKKMLIAKKVLTGSNLEPWKSEKFDLIVCDVAAVSTELNNISEWYQNDVPNNSGIDGTLNIVNVIKNASIHLNPNGKVLFTIISLSNHKKIIENLKKNFKKIRLVKSQHWPFPKSFYKNIKKLNSLKKKRLIDFGEVAGSFFYFDTYIYLAYI